MLWLILITADLTTDATRRLAQPYRAPLGSLDFYLTGLKLTVMATPLLLYLAPSGALWFATIIAAPVSIPDPYPSWWVALAPPSLAMAALDALARRRQSRSGTGADSDPRAFDLARWRAARRSGPVTVYVPLTLALVSYA